MGGEKRSMQDQIYKKSEWSTMKREMEKMNQHTAEVRRKEPQHGSYNRKQRERGKKKKRDRETKKTACGKQAHKLNHINTDWRKDGGGKQGAECCKTKPYWKSSLVL